MASAISTKVLQEDTGELFDRIKLLLQEKEAGNTSNIINGETVAIADKLFEYKCVSTKQHIFLLHESLNKLKTMK